MPDSPGGGPPMALAGIRVIDLAGPIGVFGTKLLADYGADVIKVEPPGGDALRRRGPFAHQQSDSEGSIPFFFNNTNKRGITLDLATVDGRELFRRLVRTADVVVETAAPGWMAERGIGYPAFCEAQPDLIWTAVTPYGQYGPHAHYKASDISGQAMGGIMYLTGLPGERPVRGGGHVAEKMAGYTAATATMYALYYREGTGAGQFIDVSMQEAVIAQSEGTTTRFIYTGDVIARNGQHVSATTCPAGIFPTQDGWISLVASTRAQWQALVDWMDEPRLREPRYLDVVVRFAERAYINPIVAEWSATKLKQELFVEGQRRRIPVGISLPAAESVRNVHLINRGYFVQAHHAYLGDMTVPGAPFPMDKTPWRLRRSAPLLGEHNRDVYAELGLDGEAITDLYERGVI